METMRTLLVEMDKLLDYLVSGEPAAAYDKAALQEICGDTYLEKVERLIHDLEDVGRFALELSRGNMECELPNRDNRFAWPLKQLHMQLRSITYSLEQLSKGKIVAKLTYDGPLFAQFNNLVDHIAQKEGGETLPKGQTSSWYHHQSMAALNEMKTMFFQITLDGSVFFANKLALRYVGGRRRLLEKDPFIQDDPLLQYLIAFNCKPHESVEKVVHHERQKKWYTVNSEHSSFIGGLLGFTHTVDDITAQKEHEAALQQQLEEDDLTGARSRDTGLIALADAIKKAQSGTPACSAFVDIDGLKYVNDRFGHTEGDYLIRCISQVLLESVRKTDVVSRYGGDEFLIVFQNCSLEYAQKAIARARSKLASAGKAEPKPFSLGFSAGTVSLNDMLADCGNDTKAIIAQMDEQMYEEKKSKGTTRTQLATHASAATGETGNEG